MPLSKSKINPSTQLNPENRNQAQELAGMWLLACDPANAGKEAQWFETDGIGLGLEAPVPGIIQQTYPEYHGVVWYWHRFKLQIPSSAERRYKLRFEFVDYYAEFWLNGVFLGSHEGSEMQFEFDATAALKMDEENVLAIRLINPTEAGIDGFVLVETAHTNKVPAGVRPGSGFNFGGIFVPVQLVSVPEVWISDVFLKPNAATGEIKAIVTVHNETKASIEGDAAIQAGPKDFTHSIVSATKPILFLVGEHQYELNVIIAEAKLWSLDTPYLYNVHISIGLAEEGKQGSHDYSAHCGFREFKVERGFFRLNGKRIFVRSTHTGNHYPIGASVPVNMAYLRQDLIYAKASGFNMVRFIAGVSYREQLDFCDEIGLMVYEECHAAWCLGDSPQMKERFSASTLAMARRDRNHPSVVILGLLNETLDGAVFRQARSILPALRAIDDTRLVLLSSGRWDRQLDTGSVSNPGSIEWEYEWGSEAPGVQETEALVQDSVEKPYPMGLYERAGDIHAYPMEPRTAEINRMLRSIGKGTKPVFVSELGVGSLLNVIRLTRQFEQENVPSDLHDADLFRNIAESFESDWKRFGMDEVYAFPEDMLVESERLHGIQRLHVFNLVRSNPQYCGYSLTGMLDHGYCGEGLWTFFREWKPGIMDVLQNGWAPLRWCLFVEPMHVYAGRAFRIEAVLANEDVLKPGKYPVHFKISGAKGVVWEKFVEVEISESIAGQDNPLAIPVIDEEIMLDVQSGEYAFLARMERGGAPMGGRMQFHVARVNADRQAVTVPVTLLGMSHEAEAWFSSHQIAYKPYDASIGEMRELILVGDLSQVEITDVLRESLLNKTKSGSTVIYLSPAAFKRGNESMGWFPFANKGRSYAFHDWLYHKECVSKDHAYFAGLQEKGIMDNDYYNQVIPRVLFEGQDVPDEVMAAAFSVGYPISGGYASGILLGAYKLEAGRIVLNSLRILENLGVNPTADQLLLNMIQSEIQITAKICVTTK